MLWLGCGSDREDDSKPKPFTSTSASSANSTSASSGTSGSGAGLPECDGSGGAGGGETAPGSSLGLRTEPRGDDEAVIKALGGTPFPEADPDRATKNAYLRVELGIGTETGKTTKLHLDPQFRSLSDDDWPTSYDAWTVGNKRKLVLSVAPRDKQGEGVSFCELASTANFDAAVTAAAGRLKPFVDDYVDEELFLAWGHEPLYPDPRPRLVAKNGVTFSGTPNKIVVETREGVGVVCAFPKGTELIFRSPDGLSEVKTIAFEAGKLGDYDIYVNASFGKVEPGWTLRYQTPNEVAASYVASFKKARAAMTQAWGGWSGKSKVRFTWIVPYDLGSSLDALYPGDDQVDVVGVEAINPWGNSPGAPWRELGEMLLGARTFASAHGNKPVLVTATGSLDGVVVRTTAPAAAGDKAGVSMQALPETAPVGTEVFFFDGLGKPLAKGTIGTLAVAGTTTLALDTLDAPVPADSLALVRVPTRNKSFWIQNARTFLKQCAPDVKGVIWRTGFPFGYWLDQGPDAAPDVLDAFRSWAIDPYFGG
jgi:hypothetical protein